MSFLAPAFLFGLAALAIPLLVHLIQREKKQVIEFPSLMFLRKIPYQAMRRQKLRRLLLLLMRCAALLLLAAAFARPFLPSNAKPSTLRRARETVILLDRSYSMQYGDRWVRAVAAARRVLERASPADRVSLVLFDDRAEAVVRSSNEPARLRAALSQARPGDAATQYGPALKLAQSILNGSELTSYELVLVTDFQRTGWRDLDRVELPAGTVITPAAITDGETSNFAVTTAGVHAVDSGGARLAVDARVVNQSPKSVSRRVTLTLDERALQTKTVEVPANGAVGVAFDPVAPGRGTTRAAVRIDNDRLTADDVYRFTLQGSGRISVLVLNGRREPGSSVYLQRALALGDDPQFSALVRPASSFQPSDLNGRALVVLNDAPLPGGEAGRRLRAFVENGGGLVIASGENAGRISAEWIPARVGSVVERAAERPATIGRVESSSPVFEVFNAPRSGDFAAARFYKYRELAPSDSAQVLARFDDGGAALVGRRFGRGEVLVWASTLDTEWNDLPLQPVFLPFVHSIARALTGYGKSRIAHTVGELVDVSAVRDTGDARARASTGSLVALAPSGSRVAIEAARTPLLDLREAGFYEVRGARTGDARALIIAANVDPRESSLAAMDPRELVTALQPRPGAGSTATRAALTPPEQESRQSIWRYLLLALFLLLIGETLFANHINRERTAVRPRIFKVFSRPNALSEPVARSREEVA